MWCYNPLFVPALCHGRWPELPAPGIEMCKSNKQRTGARCSGHFPRVLVNRNRFMTETNRFHVYLRCLADHDWGEPTGFGGRTCYQCIPALELERRGEKSGHFRNAWIDHSLSLLQESKDCQDFAMVAFVRMLYRYPDSALLAPRRHPRRCTRSRAGRARPEQSRSCGRSGPARTRSRILYKAWQP
jgi:hypothetical protein